ncbi:MAG: VCBS repeat-containing protein, partial [Chloroflexi bacterium]|nr:VCBS repeat-containing protein [Chloroflexota bacterium]MBU1747847.1 VCBS repeat-containing protein [Chloroflexota bacterium]
VSVLLNEGDGTFSSRADYTVGSRPYSVTAGDLDEDGDLDLVVANHSDDDVSVLLNEGCFCQLKTGPVDHRKQGQLGHYA